MKFSNLSVKRLFGRVAIGLVLSMSGITIALFFVTKQTAVLLTGGALLSVRPCGDFRTDAGVWKAAIAVYRRHVPDLRPHDRRE